MRGWPLLVCALVCAPASAQDFQWPVSGPPTQCYGDGFSGIDGGVYYDAGNVERSFAGYYATGRKLHRAIDIAVVSGTPIHAARAGVVRRLGSPSHFYGYHVVVEHGAGYYTLYAHLSRFAAGEGAQVETGALIGYSGATGVVTGPHLHFEVRHTGDTTRYAQRAHYVPCAGIARGAAIPHDYPGIGALGAPPPGTPAGLRLDDPGDGTVTLHWSAVPGAVDYEVWIERWTGTAAVKQAEQRTGGATRLTFRPQPGLSYRAWVRAGDGSQWGEWSAAYRFLYVGPPGGAPPAPAAPTGLAVSALPTSLVLAWDPFPGAGRYRVEVEFLSGGVWRFYYAWTTSQPTFRFWPQLRRTSYRFRVRAEGPGGESAWAAGPEILFQ